VLQGARLHQAALGVLMDDPLTDLLAILRSIKEDMAAMRGDLSDMRRRFIAIEARLDRQERRVAQRSGGPVDP
jgi:hypothetical protein